LGTQESQIFSTLKVRLKGGRKAFSIRGANALAKVCILADKLSIEDIGMCKIIWGKKNKKRYRKNTDIY